jgi:hypothetical protein
MFQDSFDNVEHGAAAKILDAVNPLLEGSPYDSSTCRVLKHALSFYPGYDLVEVSDYEVNPARQNSFLYKEDEKAVLLDGTNEPIYALNSEAPLSVTAENIYLYVRFFFYFVQGRFGRFNIVENVEDVNWKEEPSLAGKKVLGKMIHALELKSARTDEFVLNASIVFKDSLFETDIHVKPDGQVNLSHQELLVEDIPVLDERFSQ